jgi:hypothetical protein
MEAEGIERFLTEHRNRAQKPRTQQARARSLDRGRI